MASKILRNILHGGLIEIYEVQDVIHNGKNSTVTLTYDRGQFILKTVDVNGIWGERIITLGEKELFALKDILNSDEFKPLEAGIKSIK